MKHALTMGSTGGFACASAALAMLAPVARAQWVEADCTTLLEVVSPTAQDTFGWLVHALGDVDGDGVIDFVTSAPLSGVGASAGGKVTAHSGVNGAVLWTRVESLTSAIDGYALEVRDWNGDGSLDVFAGAPFNGADGGHVNVYSGNDGATLHVFDSGVSDEDFGASLALDGDWDGDGVLDIAIAATGHDAPTTNTGRVYVYSGATGALLDEIAAPAGAPGEGEFGVGMSFVGDVSTPRDGRDELVIARRGASFPTGRVFVFTNDGVANHVLYDTPVTLDYFLGGDRISADGDVDGDGAFDFFVGSNAANLAQIYSGADGSLLRTFSVPGAAGTGGTGRIVHDLDADGLSDVIVGARGDDNGAPNGGRAYCYSGRTGALLRTMTFTVPGRKLGWETRPVSDLDGDGIVDFALGGTGGGPSAPPPGSFVVVRGAPSLASYCTAKTTSNGCTPTLSSSGVPSASNAAAFTISTTVMEPNTPALTFFGLSAGSPAPFQGGWFCMATPVARLALKNTGGAASCSGVLTYALDEVLAHPAGSALGAGIVLHCQSWGRDALSTHGTSLSNALRFVVSP